MKKKKTIDLEGINVIELMLVKADWERTFMAEIYREKTTEGKSIVRGNVVINEGKCWSLAETQEELSNYMNGICKMKLDMGLHSNRSLTIPIFKADFFLN
jgi:hypothetical protein